MNKQGSSSREGETARKRLQRMEQKRGKRRYASYWEWSDQEVQERGIARDWIEAAEQTELAELRSADQDPPDCVAYDREGLAVGIEVTELVDQSAIEVNQRAETREDRRFRNWMVGSVASAIEGIIREKDSKNFHGGPYARLVLLIHSDEPTIASPSFPLDELKRRVFPQTRKITEAYLLSSYRSDVSGDGSCDCIELQLKGRESA